MGWLKTSYFKYFLSTPLLGLGLLFFQQSVAQVPGTPFFAFLNQRAGELRCYEGQYQSGQSCLGGAIYIGSLNSGSTGGLTTDHYMTTPGGCDDSPTPICNNVTDYLTKTWQGSLGTSINIAAITNYTTTIGAGQGVNNTDNHYGDYNTDAIINTYTTGNDAAADWCENLVFGGYNDWYLPSRYELNLIFNKKDDIPGLDLSGNYYWASSEQGSTQAWVQRFSDGEQNVSTKTTSALVRCVRRYDIPNDVTFSADWSDFNNFSDTQTLSGFNQTLSIELSAVNNTGTPTIKYKKNNDTWISFSFGSPVTLSIDAGDTLQFHVTGNFNDAATITIKNLSDSNAIVDTVAGTVQDCTIGSPTPGDSCQNGIIYVGSLSPGATSGSGTDHYMTTPGGCTDSSTPTCDNSVDTLGKRWRGDSGSSIDIVGLTNYTSTQGTGYGATNTDDQYGSENTTIIVSDPSVDINSAAQWCNDLIYGGFSDWFLPNRYELNLLYTNKTAVGGFSTNIYWSSTEYNYSKAWSQRFSNGYQEGYNYGDKAGSNYVRCMRRGSEAVDKTTGPINWADFNNQSPAETFTGFNQLLSIELSATYNSGTPTIEYQKNTDAWTSFAPGSAATLAIDDGDQLRFRISGTLNHSATITVKNLSDSNTILDTVVGTVTECHLSSVGGYSCSDGTIYIGTLNPGATQGFNSVDAYVTHPGGCTDSPTPTCDNSTDSVIKSWRGSSGSDVDIPGLTNSTADIYGDESTQIIVDHTSISSNSAADWCNDLTYGGHSDWFLPNSTEIDLIYTNKHSLPGLYESSYYWTSTEYDYNDAYRKLMNNGSLSSLSKHYGGYIRCMRRISVSLDVTPDVVDWVDFNNESITQTLSNMTDISLDISATYGTGTPTLEYQKNAEAWTSFAPGSPATLAVSSGDNLSFRILGSDNDSATITIRNASDSNALLDTVTATVALCDGTSAPGDLCPGGAIFAGTLNPGASSGGSGIDLYMTTPGGCNDSSSPTCGGSNDNFTKRWYGNWPGANADITELTNYSTTPGTGNGAINTDDKYGSTNTSILVTHSSIGSNSAGHWCNALNYGGYTDWYLPNRYELNLLFTNKASIGGFSSNYYWSSTEFSSTDAWSQRFSDGYQGVVSYNDKSDYNYIRCIRREALIADVAPSAINWADFSNNSSTETFNDFNATLSIELSASYNTGTPGLQYQRNNEVWSSFSPGSPATLSIQSGDNLSFRIVGGANEQATITVKNLSDSNTVLDTVVGTVSTCTLSSTPGDLCPGNTYYVGNLNPGATSGGSGTDIYITTPGGCNDSSTPTCNNTTDSLTKTWYGSGGSYADIADLTNYSTTVGTGNGSINIDARYGHNNTEIIINDPSIGSNSAAQWCQDLNYGGYTDWYLPNRRELDLIYTNKASLPGLSTNYYWSSTEGDDNEAWSQSFSNGYQGNSSYDYKYRTNQVRCIRREAAIIDATPDAINWVDFAHLSETKEFTNFNDNLSIELSVVYNTGSPTVRYKKNNDAWVDFSPGSPAIISILAGDKLSFQIDPNTISSATITVKNLSDSNTVLDTVTGSISNCTISSTPGDVCPGGIYYVGSLSPGASTGGGGVDIYMTTPGGCTDSATPTCNDSIDSIKKSWQGSAGSHEDLPELTNNPATDDRYGINNTEFIVNHSSIASDSAADYCNDLSYGGYTDWFLPNREELNLLYTNRASLPGLQTTEYYWSSTEASTYDASYQYFHNGAQYNGNKSTLSYRHVRCMRREISTSDVTPDAINWTNFNNTSSKEELIGFNESLSIELSAVYGTGTPTIEYQKNNEAWTSFSPGSPAIVSILPKDSLRFQVIGPHNNSATITIKNLSDSSTTLDTVTGTSSDCASGLESPGDFCAGGIYYVGSLSPGATSGSGTDHYMTTPGNCTDSSTPTCDNSADSLRKEWAGSTGSYADIAGLTNFTITSGTGNGAINTDDKYGSENTLVIVNDTSISSDSAAHWCRDLVYANYTDWFLPNRYELNLLYDNNPSIPGLLSGNSYWSSTESDSSRAWGQYFGSGSQSRTSKNSNYFLRCLRKGSITGDITPNTINWADFNNVSTRLMFDGFNQLLSIELSASYDTGTPTIEYQKNNETWTAFAPSSPATLNIGAHDELRFRVYGNLNDSATITIKNLTDSNTILDSVTGTSTECDIGSSPGDICAGGIYYVGSLSPGSSSGGLGVEGYMTTPGGCTDSSTPTCDDSTDSLEKKWGYYSSTMNINSLTDYTTTIGTTFGASNTDERYGSQNTNILVNHPQIPTDSAAHWCENLDYGGYTDWYLPNRYELNLIHDNKDSIPGLDTSDDYWTSTERSNSQAWGQNFDSGYQSGVSKSTNTLIRCVRRKVFVSDVSVDATFWADFTDYSSIETFSGFNETISIELSVIYNTGTPAVSYQKDDDSWVSFTPGSPATVLIYPGDHLQFQVAGNVSDAATITIKNLSDSNVVIDTVTGTVSDCTTNSPGDLCQGGIIYAGSLSPGSTSGSGTDHYMTTPGGCTGSNTPICDHSTDSLTKPWYGSSGTNSDISGLTNFTTTTGTGHGAINTDDKYGNENTDIIVTDASISTDSAAQWCKDLAYGGFADWYLPSRYELNLLYTNQSSIGGFSTSTTYYWSSSEYGSSSVWYQYFNSGLQGQTSKSSSRFIRCIRRGSTVRDFTPSTISWSDFNNVSSQQAFNGFNQLLSIELSASYNTGTPIVEYKENNGAWTSLTPGSPATLSIQDDDQLKFRVYGNLNESATITIKNLSDSNTILDTVTGTVADCGLGAEPGYPCPGNIYYVGSLSPGATSGSGTDHYMITPGGCTDSSTPTCNDSNDSVQKRWYGVSGPSAAITGLVDYFSTSGIGNGAINTDSNYGYENTSWAVNDAGIDANSAVQWCKDLTYGGLSDWYLPNRYELNLLYENRSSLPGFNTGSSDYYWSSTIIGTQAWTHRFYNGDQSKRNMTFNYYVRCVRTGLAAASTTVPVMDWGNFNNISSTEIFDGFNQIISVELSASYSSGTPTIQYKKNKEAWTNFSPSSPATVSIDPFDQLSFRVYGNLNDAALITITNLSDSNTVIDTVTGTSSHCNSSSQAGEVCAGGVYYLGTQSPGAVTGGLGMEGYMTTPGGCTDSSTPTCDNSTDSLTKTWKGTTGTYDDIDFLENDNGNKRYGQYSTSIIVAHSSIDSDSAADWCNDLTYAGYSDWFLPSSIELQLFYPLKDKIPGLDTSGSYYWSSDEGYDGARRAIVRRFSTSYSPALYKNENHLVRCIRREIYVSDQIVEPAIDWSDFSDMSSELTLEGFNEPISIELSTVYGLGTPAVKYILNGATAQIFSPGSPAVFTAYPGDRLQFQVEGAPNDSATITVRNQTDSNVIVDTTTGTATDCVSNSPGDICSGGVIYAGSLSPGSTSGSGTDHYMTTPGGCNDAASPICDGSTDTISKTWYGDGGAYNDITGLTNFSGSGFTDDKYGDENTSLIVNDASTGPNSAAHWCQKLIYGGFSDWHLPNRAELNLLYTNRLAIGGFNTSPSFTKYWTSTERSNSQAWGQRLSSGSQSSESKNQASYYGKVRCIRRGPLVKTFTTNAVDWANFNNTSAYETLTGFNAMVDLELSVTYGTGTPTIEYQVDDGPWLSFSPSTPATVSLGSDQSIRFFIDGNIGDSATITVTNLSDSNTVLDTVTGTVTDCAVAPPSAGSRCSGGIIYVGTLNPGATSGSGTDHYMTTPGGCTDSKTPVCDDSLDTVQKKWHGTSGSNSDISGLTNYTTTQGHGMNPGIGDSNFDDKYGDDNARIILKHSSIDSDSAAQWCRDLVYGGFADWYLPNRYELNLISDNRTAISGLTTSSYWTSTEYSDSSAWYQNVNNASWQGPTGKNGQRYIRCMRRGSTAPDSTPDSINWANFKNYSEELSFSSFNQELSIELSATYNTGTPTIQYRKNSTTWTSFTPGSPATISIDVDDRLDFQVSGSLSEAATITVTNLSDSNTVLDTVTGTVVACNASSTPGDFCPGGAVYLGSLSPGATSGSGTDYYMTTPGGCTDSSTPACNNNDSLEKSWHGTNGMSEDITALTNYKNTVGTGSGATNTDAQYGDFNTTTITAHSSIDSDSAADWCNDLSYGGYSDWYLPNRYELHLMYTNKASLPGIDNNGWYHSSTELRAESAWGQRFSDGYQSGLTKSQNSLVRCVRKF